MKKFIIIITTLLSALACTNLDDILEQLRDHEQRIQKIEALCTQLNSNVEAIQTILAALEQNDYITDITKITEAGVEIGYSITFAKGGTVNIYHGSNGTDAPAPKIGIRKASDGEYYWTSNDEWLTDESGEKIPASVPNDPDGKFITPSFRIAEGVWYISYDGGNTWQLMRKFDDNAVQTFQEVKYTDKYMYITLSSGEMIAIRLYKAESVVNFWDITDIDGLFADGKYRLESGEVYDENSSYNKSYPSTDKIYINGYDGKFKLDLQSGKTYRWQFVPYYEYGWLKMSAPWGAKSAPSGFSGKKWWFYDAQDNLIANDSKTSNDDGVNLMTIPEGAVYMRFMGWGYAQYPIQLKPIYSTLMVTEGEEEYTEYISPDAYVDFEGKENNSFACYCDFKDEVLSIVYHYNETNDMMVKLRRKGPNSIVDISEWSLLPRTKNGNVQNDIDRGIINVTRWGSDFHGPFNCLMAEHNPLNDLGADANGNKPPGFTGGNHGYKNSGASISNDPQNTPTGRSGVFRVFTDGVELHPDSEGRYCNRINIYWENFVQGQNTVLPDGNGREILQETHEVEFKDGRFSEEVRLLPLEAIRITTYYGIQGMTIQSVFGDCIIYGGSTSQESNRKLYATSVNARSKCSDAYQALCIGPEHTLFMEIDPTYDLGSRWGYKVTTGDISSIFCNAGEKLYFHLIRSVGGLQMMQGSSYAYRCSYGVKPTVNHLAVRAINNILTNIDEKTGNPDVAIVGSRTYLYYTPQEGHTLPDEIAVENSAYEWNPDNGELILHSITASVTEKVNITIKGTSE